VEPIIVDDHFKLKTYRIWAADKAVGALDIETTISPNPWTDPPQLVSVAVSFDGHTAFVFRDDDFLEYALLQANPWIMHNGLFDKLMLELIKGWKVTLHGDTMAMQYLLDPDEPKSLEELSIKYLGLEPYKDVDYKNILDEPFEKVAEMNAEDVRRTFNLYRPLANLINADKRLNRVYQWIIMPGINELIQVTLNGLPVDRERFDPLLSSYQAKVQQMRSDLEKFTAAPRVEEYPKGWPKPSWWRVGKHGKWEGKVFNPGSPHQVRHILYDVWSLPILEWTDNEENPQPTTGADVLLQLETYHATGPQQEWLLKLREFRKADKVLTSYLQSWPDLWDKDGWLHPRYKPLHVVTGRLSSDQPNVQNIPRDKEFRDLFGGVEGYTWIKADYSQIELRIAAWLAQETLILKAYENEEDLHSLTAKLVLGDETAQARQVGKTLNFGLLYGAGPATLQRIARSQYSVFLTEEEARYYHAEFFRAYPGLRAWHKQQESLLCSSGIARSPLGRIRYLPKARIPWDVEDMRGHKIGAIHQGLNHPVQSFASDLLMMSLIRLGPKLRQYDAKVVAEVHDEIDVLCPDDMVKLACRDMKEVMEDVSWLKKFGIKLGVPVVAEIETGTHWGSVT
jgi:DNA polymerase I-like protein with 3'-5' exonuclease and polymerase domains